MLEYLLVAFITLAPQTQERQEEPAQEQTEVALAAASEVSESEAPKAAVGAMALLEAESETTAQLFDPESDAALRFSSVENRLIAESTAFDRLPADGLVNAFVGPPAQQAGRLPVDYQFGKGEKPGDQDIFLRFYVAPDTDDGLVRGLVGQEQFRTILDGLALQGAAKQCGSGRVCDQTCPKSGGGTYCCRWICG